MYIYATASAADEAWYCILHTGWLLISTRRLSWDALVLELSILQHMYMHMYIQYLCTRLFEAERLFVTY